MAGTSPDGTTTTVAGRPRRRFRPRREAEDDGSIVSAAAHLGAASAVLLGGFALVKCYAVGHFSLTTGSALLSSAPLSVLLGSVMSYAYWAFPLLTLGLAAHAVRTWRRRGWTAEVGVVAGIAFLTLLLSPAYPFGVCLGAFAGFLLLTRGLPRLAGGRSRPASALRRLADIGIPVFFTAAVVWMLVVKLTDLWVPVEFIRIGQPASQQLLIGNVLQDDSTWTTVLRAGDRGLTRIQSSDIRSRTLCHLTGVQSPGQAPILWWIQGRPYSSSNLSCARLRSRNANLPLVAGSLPPG